MSANPRLDAALKILKGPGHQVGDACVPTPQDGYAMRIWIDGVPCTFEDVFKIADEKNEK